MSNLIYVDFIKKHQVSAKDQITQHPFIEFKNGSRIDFIDNNNHKFKADHFRPLSQPAIYEIIDLLEADNKLDTIKSFFLGNEAKRPNDFNPSNSF